MADKVDMKCTTCPKVVKAAQTKKGNPRLPKGWHRMQDCTYCADCWKKLFRLRAVTFPIADVTDAEWSEFNTACKAAWAESTALAQWAVNELAKGDVVRLPGETKMAKMPAIYLYGLFSSRYPRRDAWDGAAIAAASLLHAVEAKYTRRRLGVIWRSEEALPRIKYPQPYPVHNQAWSAEWQEVTGESGTTNRVPTVNIPLGGRRFTLRLRGGYMLRRQLAAFAHIASGEAIKGELAIYRVRSAFTKNGNGQRTGVSGRISQDRAPGGGNRIAYRLMCKMVAWLPVIQSERVKEGTLSVRTGRKALLVAQSPNRERPWVLKQRQMVRWIRQHARRIEDMAEDTVSEVRRPKKERIGMQDRLDTICDKQHNRLITFINTASNWLANFAERQGVVTLEYTDEDRRYFKGQEFQWATLRDMIKRKCQDRGIEFRYQDTVTTEHSDTVEDALRTE